MRNPPAFQFYARDWLADADVRLLTLEQRGVYIDLLCYCWERDGLPIDAEQLRKLVGANSNQSRRVLPAVLRFFEIKDGVYRNAKLDEIRAKSLGQSEKQAARARSRWEKERDAAALPENSRGIATAGNALIAVADAKKLEDSNSSHARTRAKEAESLPDWLPESAWGELCQYRGKKFTALAKSKSIAKLDELRKEGHDPAAVIDQTIANGWTGLFPLKSQSNGTRGARPANLPRFGQEEYTEEGWQ